MFKDRHLLLASSICCLLALLFIGRFFEQPLRLGFSLWILFFGAIIFERDRVSQQIPLVLVGCLALGAFMYHGIAHDQSVLGVMGGGMIGFGFFGLQFLVSKGKLIGEGDVYLGAALGIIFGSPTILFVVLVSYVLGALIALFLLATKRITRQTPLPLGSFLVLGCMIALFFDHPWSLFGFR